MNNFRKFEKIAIHPSYNQPQVYHDMELIIKIYPHLSATFTKIQKVVKSGWNVKRLQPDIL